MFDRQKYAREWKTYFAELVLETPRYTSVWAITMKQEREIKEKEWQELVMRAWADHILNTCQPTPTQSPATLALRTRSRRSEQAKLAWANRSGHSKAISIANLKSGNSGRGGPRKP